MQRYESYKPSQIAWLGEIPQSWALVPFKYLASFEKGRLPKKISSDPQGKPYLSMNYLRGDTPTEFVADKNTREIPAGEILLLWDGANAGEFILSKNGVLSSTLAHINVRNSYSKNFAWYYFKFLETKLRQETVGMGIPHVSSTNLKSLQCCIPSYEEQDRIVTFLDQKTAEIDAAIAKKERLIELLSDQKKILVQRAVTRGLSDGVPMRNSGVTWIGEIPAHWSIKRVRAVFKNLDSRRIPLSGEQRGKMTSRQYDYYGASGAIDKVNDYLFDEPLILIAEDGANLVMRNLRLAFIASGKYWVNNHAHILKPLAGNIIYLCEALECVDYNPLITGAAQPKLTKDALKGVEIPFPPPEEQRVIASFVSAAEMKYKEIESRFRSEIALLANLKQTTIANVVTGKIKV